MYHLTTFLLGPLLYAQGRYVRRITPRLPEAAGEREGVTGAGPSLSLLIVGDSAAAGVGVEHQDQALSGQLVAALGASYSVAWKLLAQSGDSSRQLLSRIMDAPGGKFDAVVVSIGVNDVTSLTSARTWTGNLKAIVTALQDKYSARRIYLSSLPPMHLFPALPNPLRWWLGLRARQFNRLIQDFARQHGDCRFVDISYPLDMGYIASDGFHPGGPAYQLWGRLVSQMLRDEMQSPAA